MLGIKGLKKQSVPDLVAFTIMGEKGLSNAFMSPIDPSQVSYTFSKKVGVYEITRGLVRGISRKPAL